MVPRRGRRPYHASCSQDKAASTRGGQQGRHNTDSIDTSYTQSDRYGDDINRKEVNVLRIGFQNIGGLPTEKNKLKDDNLRQGISKWEFNVFGLAEINVDWRAISEEDRLFCRTRFWWESLHLSH